jgi:choice-of-anchor C domain-containing protein
MRARVYGGVVVLGAVWAFVAAGPAYGAAFSNGSFEAGTDPGATFISLSAGATDVTGWVVRSSGIDYIGDYWTAADGSRSLDLSGGAAGGIEQAFDTLPGHTYRVTFYLAGNAGCGSTVKNVDVGATGNPTQQYTFDTTGHSTGSMGWQLETYTFVATGASTTLFFQSQEQSACGPALDAVALEEVYMVPALSAASGAGLALGLAALGWIALYRRSAV